MRNRLLSCILPIVLAIPSFPASAAPTSPLAQQASSTVDVAPNAKLDLNKADAATLQQQLSGIGSAKAQAIIDYREQHGAFASVDELLEIKGIGKALLERNRHQLTVN